MTKPTETTAPGSPAADVAAGLSTVIDTMVQDVTAIMTKKDGKLDALRAKLETKGKAPFAGKETRKKAEPRLPVPPPKTDQSVVPTGLVGNLEPPVKPTLTLPVNEWTADPKKEGIPMVLQTQNRRPLTPEEKAKLAAAKPLNAPKVAPSKPASQKVTGKEPAIKKIRQIWAQSAGAKPAAKPSKAAVKKPARGDSKVDLIGAMFKRKNGCTTAEVLEATGWTAVNMPRQAKQAGLKIKKVKDGKVTRYIAV